MEIEANWVAAIANVVIALGVLVGIFQLIITNRQASLLANQLKISNEQTVILAKQLVADHERSRREMAVKLVQTWAIQLNRKATLARRLVENLNEEQVRAIINQEQVKLDTKYLEFVKGCLPDNSSFNNPGFSFEKDDSLLIREKDASEIRWLIVSYLNLLESILLAWHNGIADKAMIENQFQYLVVPEKGHLILEKFRQAAGGTKAYPAIYAFVDELNTKNQTFKGKPALPS